MALQQPTNITPSAFAGVGGAVFDASAGLNVSWQVNGGPYLTAYRITLQKDDNASTQLYTTGRKALTSPFYGVKADGTVQFFEAETISASALAGAGVANGSVYKMVITQWWGASDNDSVTQTSASVIEACSPPSVTIGTIPEPLPARLYTFTATYSQAEGDQIEWVRWQLADQTNDGKVLGDTGNIYGTSELSYTYDGMFTGNVYAVRVQIGTQKGQQADSGWVNIYPVYSIAEPTGELNAVQKCGWNGVTVNWPMPDDGDTTGYSLYRLDKVTNEYTHLIDLRVDQTGTIDYGAKNNHAYSYQLWHTDATTYTQSPMVSNDITPCRWNDVLIAAKADADGAYHPQKVYAFGCNVETGDESNNNSPNVYKNFTRYAGWTRETAQYRTGTLKALIGKVDSATQLYTDTAELADEIMALCGTEYELFLRDRKGNLRRVRPNGAITMKIEDKWPNQATSMNFPWVEVGSMDGISIVVTSDDPLWPYDEVADTTVAVDAVTGELSWTYGDTYLEDNRGSVLSMANGLLVQTFTSTETSMADMSITAQNLLIAEQ